MAVTAQVVTVNEDAAARAADLTLDRLVLDEVRSRFAGINIDIAGAVVDATQDDDLDGGVSEITLTLRDPYNAILESGILDREEDGLLNAIDLDLGTDPDYGRLIFRLIGYDDDGHGGLTLKFEPRTVALMRRHRSRRRWRRGTVTRAEVIQAQTREVKATRIRFVSEELHKRQPLAKRTTSKAAKAGFADGAKVTWTGKTGKAEHPSAGQVANLEAALQEGQRQKAPTRVLVATAMAVIQESRGRTEATNGDHVGLFQQSRAMGWPATRDPAKDAAAFVSRAITANRASPTLGLADLVEKVQRSGQPDEYRQWEDSARRIVKAFNGGQLAGAGGSSEGAFTFYRGAPGQPLEDAWACSLRLANDVRWRLFPIGETIRYDSDETLLGAKPVATLDPGDAPVEAMPFSWDARRRVNEMTVTVRITRFALRVGQVVDVVNRGPANGRWLISKRSRSYFNSTATLTLRQPQPQRSEPREDQSQSGTGAGDIGTSSTLVGRVLEAAQHLSAQGRPYVYGGGHKALDAITPTEGLDCSSAVSLVLKRAGIFGPDVAQVSGWFAGNWGMPGEGREMTVWANAGHVFIEVKDGDGYWRMDTSPQAGDDTSERGPRVRRNPRQRSHAGFTPRHYSST